MTFVLGAAVGAGLTILALSGEGEELISKAREVGKRIKDSIDSLDKEEEEPEAEPEPAEDIA